MTGRRWWRWTLAAVVANTVLWASFLLREPVPRAVLTAVDAAERDGSFNLNSSAPYLIARREVAKGGSHGADTLAVETYQWVSVPGVIVGFVLHDALWRLALMPEDASWLRKTAWPWATTERRSWALAGTLYVGTTAWWGIVALVLSKHLGSNAARRQAKVASEPDNNELQRTRPAQAMEPRR